MAFSTTVAQRGINSQFESLIQDASARYGVPTALIKAIICQECPAWRADCTNLADPSYGLMQVNTAAHPDVTPQQMLDPSQNIPYGTQYLAYQIQRYGGDLSQAISAYNAGHAISGNVSSYVQPVLQYYNWFLDNDIGGGGNGGGTPPDWGTDPNDLKMIAALVVGGLLLFALFRR